MKDWFTLFLYLHNKAISNTTYFTALQALWNRTTRRSIMFSSSKKKTAGVAAFFTAPAPAPGYIVSRLRLRLRLQAKYAGTGGSSGSSSGSAPLHL